MLPCVYAHYFSVPVSYDTSVSLRHDPRMGGGGRCPTSEYRVICLSSYRVKTHYHFRYLILLPKIWTDVEPCFPIPSWFAAEAASLCLVSCLLHSDQENKLTYSCGSSPGLLPIYANAAKAVGRALAQNNIPLIYGGGRRGLMGKLFSSLVFLERRLVRKSIE